MRRTPSKDFHDEVAAAIPLGVTEGIRAGSTAMGDALRRAIDSLQPMTPEQHLEVAEQLVHEATEAHGANPSTNLWRHLALAHAHIALATAAGQLGVKDVGVAVEDDEPGD